MLNVFDLVLWTVGSTPLIPRLQPPDQPYAIPLNGRGLVETQEILRVKGHSRTFAIGDSATLRDPSGKLLPATAQVAFQEADFAGWNLWAAINDRPLLPFRFQNLGEMMVLGKNDASITPSFIEGFTLDGPIGHAGNSFIPILVGKLIKELLATPSDLTGADIGSVPTDGTLQNLENGNSSRITQSILLERIASEMNRLEFYIGDKKLLKKSEEIPENLLLTTLSALGRKKPGFSLAARRLAKSVIENCVEKLESPIKQFLVSSISG